MARGARAETSAGGIVYRIDKGEPRYLLIRDSYRNWGFPKGHLEGGEQAEAAAVREVSEETGVKDLAIRGLVGTIEWRFRFRGDLIHKVCHFFLMESGRSRTSPQRAEGITACRWSTYGEAERMVSYRNARDVLRRAHHMILESVAHTA
jgi:ADP-ribose pyrophosphatase YjhB (NUDIX family)